MGVFFGCWNPNRRRSPSRQIEKIERGSVCALSREEWGTERNPLDAEEGKIFFGESAVSATRRERSRLRSEQQLGGEYREIVT